MSGSDPWVQDSLEIFLDAGNAKNGPYRFDDTQIRISAENVTSFGTGDVAFQARSARSETASTEDGYVVEAAVSLLEHRRRRDRSTGSTSRSTTAPTASATSIRNWADPTGLGYQSTARWGVGRARRRRCEGTDRRCDRVAARRLYTPSQPAATAVDELEQALGPALWSDGTHLRSRPRATTSSTISPRRSTSSSKCIRKGAGRGRRGAGGDRLVAVVATARTDRRRGGATAPKIASRRRPASPKATRSPRQGRSTTLSSATARHGLCRHDQDVAHRTHKEWDSARNDKRADDAQAAPAIGWSSRLRCSCRLPRRWRCCLRPVAASDDSASERQPGDARRRRRAGHDQVVAHPELRIPGLSLWKDVADEYMADHPNVTIDINVQENEAFKKALQTNLQAGDVPDIFQSWGGGGLREQVDAASSTDITDGVEAWDHESQRRGREHDGDRGPDVRRPLRPRDRRPLVQQEARSRRPASTRLPRRGTSSSRT